MLDYSGFDKFHKWAQYNAINYILSYHECDDVFEIEITSAAKEENFYRKRVYSFESFIKQWEEHVSNLIKVHTTSNTRA